MRCAKLVTNSDVLDEVSQHMYTIGVVSCHRSKSMPTRVLHTLQVVSRPIRTHTAQWNEFSGSHGELEEPGGARLARATRSFGADGASDDE